MQIIAHRGWSESYPENTHAAFAAATTTGCQGIEFDVRLSADGVVVVSHDATLARFGGSSLPVSRQTLSELRMTYPVPTLAEVLDGYRQVELLIEVKPHGGPVWTSRLLTAIYRQIRQPAVRERVQLLCFNPGVLRAAHAAMPRLRLVRNCTAIPRDSAGSLGSTGSTAKSKSAAWMAAHAYCYALDPDFSAWTPALVAMAKKHGLRTSAYTINRLPELRRMAALKLDAIITNRPLWAGDWLHDHI